jgi:HAD superfamily hydrolase (TIGR01490 family)
VSTLALFDLDGTLTRGDTMLAFIRARSGPWKYLWMLIPAAVVHALGRIRILPADAGKRRLMRAAFAGVATGDVVRDAERFAKDKMPVLIREGAMECLRWHVAEGHRTIIVSASCDVWLVPWCAAEALELIATGLEERGGRYTGELSTSNCNGEEKVRRLRKILDPARYEHIYAYGDTPSDRPMLALATNPRYKPFHQIDHDRTEPLLAQEGAAKASIRPKGLVAVAFGLALVATLLIAKASKPITEAEATGNYEYVPEIFPRHGDWPDEIRFLPHHQVRLEDSDGTVRFEGPWHWDEKVHALRLDDPAWDRRVRWVHGWGGPVLEVASPVGKGLFQVLTFKRME